MTFNRTLITLLAGAVIVFSGKAYTKQQTSNFPKSYKGYKILGETMPKGNWDIYVMNFDGSNKVNLTNTPYGFFERYAKWSPDGKKIIYITDTPRGSRKEQPEYAGEIWIMNADGAEKKNLTNNPAVDSSPSWSPDGKKIVFVSSRDGNREIYVMNADGTDQKNTTNNLSVDYAPKWSPDGKKIAFLSTRGRKEYDRKKSLKKDKNIEIYVMNSDGTNLKNITNHPGKDSNFAWSPDGEKIAFSSIRDNNEDIYTVNTDGSGLKRLTTYSGDDEFAGWSPDGKKLYFVSDREKGATKSYMNIGDYKTYSMNLDGSNVKKFMESLPWGGIIWSPDGKIILTSKGEDLYFLNPDGTENQKFEGKAMSNMSWSPLPTEDKTTLSVNSP